MDGQNNDEEPLEEQIQEAVEEVITEEAKMTENYEAEVMSPKGKVHGFTIPSL